MRGELIGLRGEPKDIPKALTELNAFPPVEMARDGGVTSRKTHKITLTFNRFVVAR